MRLIDMRILLSIALCACAGQSTVATGERGPGPKDSVPASALPPGSCDDATLVTLEDLAAGTGDGERIAVDLVPQVRGMCTLLACDSECCNQCGGDYYARLQREPAERDLELYLSGAGSCSGMDCNFHCEPFGVKPTTRYRFVGKTTFKAAGATAVYRQATMTVEKVCRL